MEENGINLNICYGCMRKLEEGQQICHSCSYDSSLRQNPENTLPEGTVLSRKYLIGRVLGRGGFGVTYLGYDLDLQLTVAIKEYFPREVCHRSSQRYDVRPESGVEDGTVFSKGCEVFLDEARTLAKFNSPYIVHVRDFFREHGTAYIVMDFAEGVTLKAEMKKNGGKLPYERVLPLMEPVISQLEQLHSENIIHRDIKPENMVLVQEKQGEHLVLLDFGAAREYVLNETRTMTGVVTPGYSPLEQYSQKSRQGPYTDVYALCATMYHAITGVLPPASIERNIDGSVLKTFEECGVIVPKTVEQAIMHGLALKSTERTQTMGQLLAELNGANTAERTAEAKNYEMTQKSQPEKQVERNSTQTGSMAQEKDEKRSSAAPKIVAAFVAGILLFAGIYYGFLRNTGGSEEKQRAAQEIVAVSAEPASVTASTPVPIPTSTPKPNPTSPPTSTPTPTSRPTPTATSTPMLTMAPTPAPTPVSTPAATPKAPSADDLWGQDGVAYPSGSWLSEYQIKYIKGTTSGNAYLRYSPSKEGREYQRYIAEGEKVTVLAYENGYALVKATDGRAGWVTSKFLVDRY